jgi:hypothetical protein
MEKLVENYCRSLAPGVNFQAIVNDLTLRGKTKFLYFFDSNRTDEYKEVTDLPPVARAWVTYMHHLTGQNKFTSLKGSTFNQNDITEMQNTVDLALLTPPSFAGHVIFFNLFPRLGLEDE